VLLNDDGKTQNGSNAKKTVQTELLRELGSSANN
jgi:hypothetical protein